MDQSSVTYDVRYSDLYLLQIPIKILAPVARQASAFGSWYLSFISVGLPIWLGPGE